MMYNNSNNNSYNKSYSNSKYKDNGKNNVNNKNQYYKYNYVSYCTEINPTNVQKGMIEEFFRVCTLAYNQYLDFNKKLAEESKYCVAPDSFLNQYIKKLNSDELNVLLLPQNNEAINKTLKNAERAINKYISGKANYPSAKNIGTKNISYYFKRTKDVYYIKCERHRIYIPYIGWVRLKEKGYIPYKGSDEYVISGWIKKNAGRYYVSALINEKEKPKANMDFVSGIGIDLNLTNFATISTGQVIDNINKGPHVKKLQEKIKRESRAYNHIIKKRKKLVKEGLLDDKDLLDGKNLKKRRLAIDKKYRTMKNIRDDFTFKTVHDICINPYSFIAMEDLRVLDMVSEHRFAKYIALQNFYKFKLLVHKKCVDSGTELRIVDRWYPSSKTCHSCGAYFSKLTIDDREFECPKCGERICRDLNAALNIRDSKEYFVWV